MRSAARRRILTTPMAALEHARARTANSMQRQAPGYYRYRVGEIVVTDGERSAPLDDKFVLNAKVALAEYNNVVKVFRSDRTDQPFSISILPRGARRRGSIADAPRSDSEDKDLLHLLALMTFIIFFQAYMVAPDQHGSNHYIVNAGRSRASRKGSPLSIT